MRNSNSLEVSRNKLCSRVQTINYFLRSMTSLSRFSQRKEIQSDTTPGRKLIKFLSGTSGKFLGRSASLLLTSGSAPLPQGSTLPLISR